MSIHIDMEFYCDGCSEMDPEVENTVYHADGRPIECQTDILCKHRYMCQNIYQHIVSKLKEKEKEK